ncbi:related to Transcription initiation factor TFIID subunit 9 [Nakaseomyces glabratus]|nr:related to Transcription initiation factor TFIID subunit 9 [Nakaseomyces glabratus]
MPRSNLNLTRLRRPSNRSAARTQYMFKPTAPKELLLQLAAERNKKALPQVMGSWGVRLPPEKYCLTAKSWDLDEKEEK